MGPIRESETVQDEEILPSPCGERTDNRLDLDRHKEEYVANGSQGHPYHRFTTQLRIVAGMGQEPEAELALT